MDILLLGKRNFLMDALIKKIYKEGDQIFVISGSPYRIARYPRVYEQYDFTYVNISMLDIMESIRPDVAVFFGAFDDGYDWQKGQEEAVRYSAGLYNVMLAASSLKDMPRFIYLSSHEVFAHQQKTDITEETRQTPEGVRAIAIAQGEETVADFKRLRGMDTCVLRFDHLYGTPLLDEDSAGLALRMCKEADSRGVITVNKNLTFSTIHENDAAAYIYDVLSAEKLPHSLYHLSTGNAVTEEEYGEIVSEAINAQADYETRNYGSVQQFVRIEERSYGAPHRAVLSNALFLEDFHERVFWNEKKGITKAAQEIWNDKTSHIIGQRNRNVAKSVRSRMNSLVRALLPYIENVILFIIVYRLNGRALNNEFTNVVDFYLLYVLVFAVAYGQQQATFSAFLSMIGYFFQHFTDEGGYGVLLSYSNYVWLAQLFIVGLVVGHMRDQRKVQDEEDRDQIDYLAHQVRDVEEINSTNVRMKNLMHDQLVNQKDSLGIIYSATSSLAQYDAEEVLFQAAGVLKQLMHTEDAAIYKMANADYGRLFSSTSDTARMMGNSLKITDIKPICDEFKAGRVFINRNLEPGLPLMAEGIYSEDRLELVLMIWGIPWDRMNLSEANMLRIIGYLIQNEVLKANRYLEAVKDENFIPGSSHIMNEKSFGRMVSAYINASDKGLTQCRVVDAGSFEELGQEKTESLSSFVRGSDYLGIMEGRVYLLLANTDSKGAGFVLKRLESQGFKPELKENMTT